MEVIKKGNGPNPVFIEQLLEPKSNEELLAEWETAITARTDTVYRDSIVEEMLARDLRPDVWMQKRDIETGIYPDSMDPDFAARLARKTEFATLASQASDEDTCSKSQKVFETTAVQRLVARFLHPSTPYRGILLNHGVGVGKTCSAITVAETYLEMLPQNTVYILCPQAIADGFRRTIFDVSRLKPAPKEQFILTGERWDSPQCSGMTYLRLTNTAANENKDEIAAEVAKVVNRRYKIIGYRAFANWVKKQLDKIPDTVKGVERDDMEKETLMNLFADHLIIVDEAHNLRDVAAAGGAGAAATKGPSDEVDEAKLTDAAEGKLLTPILKQILKVAEGLRLMLMTATPMYDTAPEIVFLLNLLTLNDTKDEGALMKVSEIFSGDGRLTDEGAETLATVIKRYVSYMRGENPNTFPLRLTPEESGGDAFMEEYPTISISRSEGEVAMTPMDRRILAELPLIVHTASQRTRVGKSLYSILERNANPEGRAAGPIEISDFILDQTMQMGNITYPNGLFGGGGWSTYMKAHTRMVEGRKVAEFEWNPPEDDETVPTLEDVFVGEGLRSHAPKIAGIVESIIRAKGISFIYSRFVSAGALPIAIALEMAGWCRVLSDGTPAPLLRSGAPKGKYKNFYILLTSDEQLSPDFAGLIKYATTFATPEEAAEGTRVKAIIGSQIASEGLDLKCIRELHLLDGWYHLNRIEQIEGRGVRYCSHTALPIEERNCLIYLHVINVDVYETADLYAYRLAVRKAQPIGKVTRLMKRFAWDCTLNRDAILLTDLPARRIVDAQGRITEEYDLHDKPFTSFCDFSDKCEYLCAVKPIPAAEFGKNKSTVKEIDYRRKFAQKSKILADLFAEEDVAIPLELLKTTVFRDIPWSMAAIGLREMLGKMRLQRGDGVYGTLLLQNGYVVFQPQGVTDSRIPLALRYGRAYGRLPRVVEPERKTIMGVEAPLLDVEPVPAGAAGVGAAGAAAAVVPAAAGAGAAAALDPKETALESLRKWHGILKQIVAGTVGKLETGGLPEETFDGWRWIFQHFGSLAETIQIGCHWWMDNIWKAEERIAVFSDWLKRGLGTLEGDERLYAEQYQPTELFSGELSGFQVFQETLQTYCYAAGDAAPAICPSISMRDVLDIIGKPVDRKADTGPVFGFLVSKAGNVVFKTVDKEKGDMKGAECSNTSNLKNHERRIVLIQNAIRENFDAEDEITTLLLDDVGERKSTDKVKKERQAAVLKRFGKEVKVADAALDLKHISDLTLKQSCPFMEFMLRWMDRRRVGGRRWFLTVVQSARAGVKMT